MAYTSIDDPSKHFQAKEYTGTGSTQSVVNGGNSNLKPDWVWVGGKSVNHNNAIFDSSRGATKEIISNGGNAESTDAQLLTQFDTDGFTVGTNSGLNGSGDGYIAWQWKANGGTTSSNTNGTATTTVQANTTAGFSIVLGSFTGSTKTYGHGLGVAPDVVLWKNRSNTNSWLLFTTAVDGSHDYGILNQGNAFSATSYDLPTSTVFSGNDDASTNFVAYCFAEKQGYSKFGSYTGNGNSNGTFVYTGFKPAFFICKRTDSSANWLIFDIERSTNLNDNYIYANSDSSEGTSTSSGVDFLSNGVKMRNTYNDANVSSATYFYMAFAHNPFVTSTGTPTTAR